MSKTAPIIDDSEFTQRPLRDGHFDGPPARTIADIQTRIGVAEYAILENGTLSTSGLGSCVAVAIYEPGGPGGLLHAMLPRANSVPGICATKCVDTGIDTLYDAVLGIGGNRGTLVAKLAGGSAMLDLTGPAIGDRNIAAAHETLAAHSIHVIAEDVGGKRGRSVSLSIPSGDFRIRSGDRFDVL